MSNSGRYVSRYLLIAVILSFFSLSLPALEPQWQLPTGGQIVGTPAASSEGVVYALSEDRHLYAVKEEGGLIWKHYLYNLPLGSITIGFDGSLYLPLSNGELAAVNPAGREIWRYRAGGKILTGVAVSSLGFIYFADESGNLHCLDNRGSLRWRSELPDLLTAHLTEIPGWGVLASQKGGRITAYDMRGDVRWHFLAAGNTGQPVTDGTYFYAGTEASTLVCIDTKGRRMWSRTIPSGQPKNLLILEDALYFVTDNSGGRLYRYQSTEERLEFIELETKSPYLFATADQLVSAGREGGLEFFSQELLPIRETPMKNRFNGAVFLESGTLAAGGSDWRISGYGLSLKGADGWNQAQGGSERRSSANPLSEDVLPPPGGDELFLVQLLETGGENNFMRILSEIEDGFRSGRYLGCEMHILNILERLAGEGVLNPLYQEGKVLNDFPRVRMRAAELLGEHGTLKSQQLLLAVFKGEWESSSAAVQMKALGAIGSDLRGDITRTLVDKLPRGGSFPERQLYAVSALSLLKELVIYRGALPDPSALEMIMTVYRGSYGREARKAALDFMGSR